MTTLKDIIRTLPRLTTDELQFIELAIHKLYRIRGVNILYDDAYGIWTEQDQNNAALRIFELIDNTEDS